MVANDTTLAKIPGFVRLNATTSYMANTQGVMAVFGPLLGLYTLLGLFSWVYIRCLKRKMEKGERVE